MTHASQSLNTRFRTTKGYGRLLAAGLLLAPFLFLSAGRLLAQGVTTGSVTGTITSEGAAVSGASIIAVHAESGTRYGAVSRADGRFSIPGMRVGGPYTITVSHIGFETQERNNVYVNLGTGTDLAFAVRQRAVAIEGITATAERDAIMSPNRTGAATTLPREALAALPTISGRFESVARLSPQSGGGMSFAGQDSRLNNITVDGSYFNNSFGLGNTPGDRTGVAPISLAAIEQVQVNIAPYDVRQGNFVGAGVNSVTRSGTNQFRGSVYHQRRDNDLVGTQAGPNVFNPGTFNFKNWGGWASGPIIKNKLFFFANFEDEALQEPGTTFLANTGGQTVGGSITRVRATMLDSLSTFLQTKFDYDPGAYQGYNHETPATRFLGKLDYNLSDRNKISVRYNHLDSFTDVLASNSSSLGFGTRRSATTGLNFQNSNYQILENIRSVVGEWNSLIGTNKANNLIIGYTYQDESRASRGTFFPFVDILEAGTVLTSFGFEPFTPSNELRYKTAQLQNNFSIFGEKHTVTFGISGERYESENVFFPGSQSVYVYSSINDFYTDANGYLANPSRTTSPVTLRRFQVRWNNIPGSEKPVQPLEVFFGGAYAQDEWQVNTKLKVTAGLRVDAAFFGETAFANSNADARSFRDEDGNTVQYETGKLPDPSPLFSPRIGFNYDVTGTRSTQVRGGTGIFTGRPAYVWISNQIGNTGVLTGFAQLDNTTTRPFHPDPNHYKPTAVTGAPATSYELALTDPDFKFPQLWRTNAAIDQRLPLGLIGTAEFLYNKDVNGVYYINANLPAPQATFAGPDNRPRWCVATALACPNGAAAGTSATRLPANQTVSNAIVLKNQNVGWSWNAAASLERAFEGGLFVKAAYSYGEAKNTVDPGSIAFGSWNNNQHAGNPNNPGLGYAGGSPGHRVFLAGTYRREWFKFGATTVSLFWEGRPSGQTSYTYGGDMNGDGGTSNDLLYIPKDANETVFVANTVSASGSTPARTFTPAEQAAAWEAYVAQDEYLSARRGQYAERGGIFLPLVYRADVGISQDLFTNIRGTRNGLRFRADILNVGNLINSEWGVGQRLVNTQPLIPAGVDATGRPTFRMRSINKGTSHELMSKSLEPTNFRGDVYQIMLRLEYSFN